MNRLREFREALGLSQQRLADQVNPSTSQAQIDRLEKGERKLDFEWARRLAPALGKSWPELIDETELPPLTREMIALFEMLAPEQQQAVMALLRSFVAAGGAAYAAGPGSRAFQLNEPWGTYVADRRSKA